VFYGSYSRLAKCHVSLFLCKHGTATYYAVADELVLGFRCVMNIYNLIELSFLYRESNRLQSSTPIPPMQTIPSGTPMNLRRVRIVPALPPRPHRPVVGQNYIPHATNYSPYASYGSYGTTYGGFSGIGAYGSTYGGFGSYGSYGMNRLGYNLSRNDPESRYINLML
jgi:hypothetical protein